MKKSKMRLLQILGIVIGVMLLSSCGSQPETAVTPTATVSGTEAPPPGTSSAGQAILDAAGLSVIPTLVGNVPTRTPEPTATPDVMTREINRIVQYTGLSGTTLFWLDITDWISLGLSLLIVLISYLLGTWVTHWLLPRLVKRTQMKLDDRLLQVSGGQVRWLVVVFILRFAVKRLNFVNPGIKTFITDICFLVITFLIASLLWRLISLLAQQAGAKARKAGHQKEAESLITLMVWGLRALVVIVVLGVILIHYGINVTGFAIILAVIAFALSLAGRDILTDIISGAMILIDRPFRIGDRLELQSINSWGDVVDIGMRSTKILSVENRTVILPNSQIGKNQVVNYSYSDPSYFNTLDVYVAYDNDPDQVADIIVKAIRSVEGVQVDRDVLAWLHEFKQYSMSYWACWWVANYADRYAVQNRVSRAIILALNGAGVVLPYQKGSLNIQGDPPSPKLKQPQESQS